MKQIDDINREDATPERLAKAQEAGDDAIENHVTDQGRLTRRLYDGDIIELLLRRGIIDSDQYWCGNEFYRHWYQSGLANSGVVDPSRTVVDGGQHNPQSEQSLWHLQKWKGMVQRLGQVHSSVLCDCVLLEQSLVEYGRIRGKRANAKKAQVWAQARLTAALEQLVINELPGKRMGIRGQMDEADRPQIKQTEDNA